MHDSANEQRGLSRAEIAQRELAKMREERIGKTSDTPNIITDDKSSTESNSMIVHDSANEQRGLSRAEIAQRELAKMREERIGKTSDTPNIITDVKPDTYILSLKNQLLNAGYETFMEAANKFGELARSSPEKITPVIPLLIKDLYSQENRIRRGGREDRIASGSAMALSEISKAKPDILVPWINDFIKFLDYTKTEQPYEIIAKRATLVILGEIGITKPNIAIPIITQYLEDQDEYVQKNAKQALKIIHDYNHVDDGSDQRSPVNQSSSRFNPPDTYSKRYHLTKINNTDAQLALDRLLEEMGKKPPVLIKYFPNTIAIIIGTYKFMHITTMPSYFSLHIYRTFEGDTLSSFQKISKNVKIDNDGVDIKIERVSQVEEILKLQL